MLVKFNENCITVFAKNLSYMLQLQINLEILCNHNVTFQQDTAPAYRSRETIKLLKAVTPDFFLPKLWPSNTLHLNPVDYKIRRTLVTRQTNKHMRNSKQAIEYFLTNATMQFSLKYTHILKSYNKKQRSPNFMEHGVLAGIQML